MTKTKMSWTALAATLLISAAFAASANAATQEWMVGGTALSGSAPLASTAATMETFTLQFSGVTIDCTGSLNDVDAKLEAPATFGIKNLEFTGCTATGKNCSLVGTTLGTLPLRAETTLEGAEGAKIAFSPRTGTLFATLELTGSKCSYAEEVQPVGGKATAILPTLRQEHKLQEIAFGKTGGIESSEELEVGGKSASLAGSALLKLASSKQWSLL